MVDHRPDHPDQRWLHDQVVLPGDERHGRSHGAKKGRNRVDSPPFCSVDDSRLDKHYAKDGFDAFGNTKALLIDNPDLDIDVFLPYTGKDIANHLTVIS
ncbi:hypothetical protein ACYX7E_06250 [Luteimonas sp. RIT-PG2_3]